MRYWLLIPDSIINWYRWWKKSCSVWMYKTFKNNPVNNGTTWDRPIKQPSKLASWRLLLGLEVRSIYTSSFRARGPAANWYLEVCNWQRFAWHIKNMEESPSFFCSFRFFLGGNTHFLLAIWNHNSYFTVHVTWFFVNPLLLVVFNWSFQDRLSHHPRYGDPELQRPALNGTVFFAGTETARRHGGAIVGKCEASYCRCSFQSNHLAAF